MVHVFWFRNEKVTWGESAMHLHACMHAPMHGHTYMHPHAHMLLSGAESFCVSIYMIHETYYLSSYDDLTCHDSIYMT